MSPDELSFVTQQLAGMLKSGIALEGGLKQLCTTMKPGRLRAELERLELDLAQGHPLSTALGRRELPPLFASLLRVGQASNDLPGVLTLLADYYRKASDLWTRMNGLLVYPLIVLIASFLLSVLLAVVFTPFLSEVESRNGEWGVPTVSGTFLNLLVLQMWLPLLVIAGALAGWVLAWRLAWVRHWLRWRLPGFREASFSRLASALSLMLSRGCPVGEAVDLLQKVESGSSVRSELARWHRLLAEGVTRFPELTRDSPFVPPLFSWIVAGSGEDWAAGFRRAAEIYHGRAMYRFEMMLYAALPVSVCFLGFLLVAQMTPIYLALSRGLRGLAGSAGLGP